MSSTVMHISLRDDRGFSLAELTIGAALGSILVVILGIFLVNSLRTGAFTQGQSETINNVRNAVQQIEKEVRGADSLSWAPSGACSAYTAGRCVTVGAQSPSGVFKTVRYTHIATQLRREVFDSGTSTWGPARSIIERVANTGAQPVFTCDTQVTLLRLTVDLYIEPTPASNPNFHVQTSIRPRNFPSIANCS